MPTRQFHWSSVNDCVMHETDGDGNTLVEYTHEPGPYGPLISEHRDGHEYVHHYDAQGATTMLNDEAGEVTDTFTYDAWGNEVARTGTTETPYRWVGRWGYRWDDQTQSYYVRHRIFEPTIGRWTSHDPLGIRHLLNLFLYVLNQPSLRIDPSGLKCDSSPTVSPVRDGDGVCLRISTDHTKWEFKKGLVTKTNGTTLSPAGLTVAIVSEITCYFERKVSACYKCNSCCFSSPPADNVARRDAHKQAGFGRDPVPDRELLFAQEGTVQFTPAWWQALVNLFKLYDIELPEINLTVQVLTDDQQKEIDEACNKRIVAADEMRLEFYDGPSPHPMAYECSKP